MKALEENERAIRKEIIAIKVKVGIRNETISDAVYDTLDDEGNIVEEEEQDGVRFSTAEGSVNLIPGNNGQIVRSHRKRKHEFLPYLLPTIFNCIFAIITAVVVSKIQVSNCQIY